MMSKKNKYGNIDPENLLRYTGDGMSEEERHALEREMQKDPFSEEALDGLSSLDAIQARSDLSKLYARLHKRVAGKSAMIWVRVAASVAVLLTIGTIYFTVFKDKAGLLDRKVAETESVESQRNEVMPAEIQTEPIDADSEMQLPEVSPTKQEKNQVEDEVILVVADEVNLTEEESGSEDSMVYEYISADADSEFELAVAGTEEAELTLPGEEVLAESPVTARSTAREGASTEDIAGINYAEPIRAERSAGKSMAVSAEAKKLSDTGAARPVGGEELFNEYLAENIRFPGEDSTLTRGDVVLSFIVGPQGRPQNIEVEESPGEAFSIEAIRLLQEGPDWLPAIDSGIPVKEKSRLKIEFIKE